MTLGELIDALGGRLAQGTAQWQIDGVSSAELASPSDLVFAEDADAAGKALASLAGAVVLPAGSLSDDRGDKCIVETDQPRLWFAMAAKLLRPVLPARGIHHTGVVGTHAELADGVTVGPCAVVED